MMADSLDGSQSAPMQPNPVMQVVFQFFGVAPVPHAHDSTPAFLLTLMIPGFVACVCAAMLAIHTLARSLIVRRRHKVVLRDNFAAFEDVNGITTCATVAEKTFIELHGGLVLYCFKVIRSLSCVVSLSLSIGGFQKTKHGKCLFGISEKCCSTSDPFLSSAIGLYDLDWIQFSLCATSVFSVILSVITVVSHTWFSRLVSAYLSVVLFTLFAVYVHRDVWPLLTFKGQPIDSCEGPLLLGKLVALTIGALIYPLFSPRVYVPVDFKKPSATPHPEQIASWASLLSYTWIGPTVRLAHRLAHLPYGLLPPLSDQDSGDNLKQHAFPHLDQFSGTKKRHIFYGLMTVFRFEIIVLSSSLVIQVLASLIAPFSLKYLLRYVEIGGEGAIVRPWAWILVILFGTLVSSLAYQWYNYIECRTMVRAEAILSQLIFEHALRIRMKAEVELEKLPVSRVSTEQGVPAQASAGSSFSATKSSTKNLVGRLNNLVTLDLATANDGRDFLMLVLFAPLQLTATTWLLYTLLDWSALVGLASMIVTSPLLGMVVKRIQHVKQEQSKKTDARVQSITEAVGVIRMVKLQGWESQIEQRISDKREDELAWIWQFKMMELVNGSTNFCLPLITMLVTYATYTIVMGRTLSASTVFASLSAFDLLRNQLRSIFFYLPRIISARVSLDRINEFLQDTELLDRYEPGARDPSPILTAAIEDSDLIGFRNTTFTWSRDGTGDDGGVTPFKRNFTLQVEGEVYFQHGSINVIIGPTGSGKTSMLMALLGEMHWIPSGPHSWYNLPRTEGVAYGAQESWVQNDSIKNNILFGTPYDDARYKQVLYQCALEKDLESFEAGDDTEVGEKGLTLSGGQKARVTLARAIYSLAKIILLDDVLAALDAHTASWIVDKCFAGELIRGRTVILVTHNIAVVHPVTQFVVSLASNGRVINHGSFSDVVAKDETLAVMISREQGNLEKEGEVEAHEDKKVRANGDENGKLMIPEEVSVGHVSWAAFKLYLASLGGQYTAVYWAVVLTLLAITSLANTLQTWFLGYWASQYEDHPAKGVNVSFYLSGLTLLLIFGASTWWLAYFIFYLGAMKASRVVHNKLISAILGTTFRWLDTTPASRIIARCTQDIGAIDGPLSSSLALFLGLTMKMVFSLGAVVVITPAFLLPGIIIGVLGAWIGHVYMKAQLSVKREMSNAKAPVLGHLGAAMAGLTSVRAYGAEEMVIKESLSRINKYTRVARTFYDLNRWMGVRVDALGALFATALAGYLVYGPKIHQAANIGFSLNTAVLFNSLILWWVRCLNEVEVHGNSLERVESYFRIEQEPKPIRSGVPPADWPTTGELRVEDLSACYSLDGPKVLHNLSFHIKSGERVGVVGRTGSGKSSLTLSILRCIFTEGQIYLDGLPISEVNLDALRSRVTIIPQVPELLSGTLRANLDPFDEQDDVTLNSVLRSAGLFTVQKDSEESRLTLDSLISDSGGNLSVGQRQILALARAMVRRSKLVIFDEATSAIDYKTDAIIQASLRSELSEATQLIVAHRLQTIMDADKIMVLDAGKLVEFGAPSELLRNERGMLRALVDESGDRDALHVMASVQVGR